MKVEELIYYMYEGQKIELRKKWTNETIFIGDIKRLREKNDLLQERIYCILSVEYNNEIIIRVE